jgi:hypothetical protein
VQHCVTLCMQLLYTILHLLSTMYSGLFGMHTQQHQICPSEDLRICQQHDESALQGTATHHRWHHWFCCSENLKFTLAHIELWNLSDAQWSVQRVIWVHCALCTVQRVIPVRTHGVIWCASWCEFTQCIVGRIPADVLKIRVNSHGIPGFGGVLGRYFLQNYFWWVWSRQAM